MNLKKDLSDFCYGFFYPFLSDSVKDVTYKQSGVETKSEYVVKEEDFNNLEDEHLLERLDEFVEDELYDRDLSKEDSDDEESMDLI